MLRTFLFFSLCLSGISAFAADTLTVEQCRQIAMDMHPLQQRKALAAQTADLQRQNIRTNNLPRINLGAQASWQSDVFKLPIENPLFAVPAIPKDQYKISLDVSERIWDGGSDRYLRRQKELEQSLSDAQTAVEVEQVRTLVTDLFAQTLLLQETQKVLELTIADLHRRAVQTNALVTQGVALQTAADQVQMQILKVEQQRDMVEADRRSALQVLSLWLGRENADIYLQAPADWNSISPASDRPEYQLFELQRQQTQLGQDMLQLRRQPRIEAFAQGGLGQPNPFNFFETGWQPFGIVGIRAAWVPLDWGTTRREKEILALQAQQIGVQQETFDRGREATKLRSIGESDKYNNLLLTDEAMINLQTDILRRAEGQVQNGVMTMTEYLSQVDLLTQARLTREAHRIQAWQALEKLSQQ